jgi:hypothetical protein
MEPTRGASEASERRTACSGLHRAERRAAHCLFSRVHSGRYFGGLWFKIFRERGPC